MSIFFVFIQVEYIKKSPKIANNVQAKGQYSSKNYPCLFLLPHKNFDLIVYSLFLLFYISSYFIVVYLGSHTMLTINYF